MDVAQRAIVDAVRADTTYLDLHLFAHQQVAQTLVDVGIAAAPADDVFDAGVTRTFLPHGLGTPAWLADP